MQLENVEAFKGSVLLRGSGEPIRQVYVTISEIHKNKTQNSRVRAFFYSISRQRQSKGIVKIIKVTSLESNPKRIWHRRHPLLLLTNQLHILTPVNLLTSTFNTEAHRPMPTGTRHRSRWASRSRQVLL